MSKWFAGLFLATSLFTTASAQRFAQPPPLPPQQAARAPVADIFVVASKETVRAALAQARGANLASFRAYEAAGVYPNNTYANKSLNVWRDREGHFCAAATIIRKSGQIELTDKVAAETNFIRLADVTSGVLMDWMLTSGFTKEEIVQIQEPNSPIFRQGRGDVAPPVDPDMRSAENARMKARYAVIDAQLVKGEARALDLATERLLANPKLASEFVNRAGTVD